MLSASEETPRGALPAMGTFLAGMKEVTSGSAIEATSVKSPECPVLFSRTAVTGFLQRHACFFAHEGR
ncbi:hypothetical protein ACRAWF_32260 [Streptomyces sp. L7]